MDLPLMLSLLMLFCIMAAPLPAVNFHRQEAASYEHMDSHGFPWIPLDGHSDSERILVEERHEFNLSSTDAHHKRDLHALLSFRNAVIEDPKGLLSNWTAENSDNMCSTWFGIGCEANTSRVVAIFLSGYDSVSLKLRGTLSPSVGNLKALQTLDLSVGGPIPGELGLLHKLRTLYLFDNAFTGGIPPEFGHLKALQTLELTSNKLRGPIPMELGLLQKLMYLDLSDNKLSGPIPIELYKLQKLKYLDLSDNMLSGPIPVELGMLQKLQILDLEDNYFSGRIPCELGTLTSSFNNCTELVILDLRKCGFIGELPSTLINLDKLGVLSISYNNLHGTIPQWITNFTNLFLLDLSNNNFNGRIPYDLGRLQGFAVNESNWLEHPFNMEEYIKGIKYNVSIDLTTNIILDLSKNNLTGEIPTSIGNMRSLRLLNFSGNQLEGKIPASFSKISTLEQLDLSKNHLSGAIPQELSQLTMLAYLDVSSNDLCGKIPKGTQFDTFNESSFQKNKCLCGYPLPQCNQSYIEAPSGDNGSQSNIKRKWLTYVDGKMSLTALAIGIGIGFWGVLAMFIVWEKARNWVLGLPPTSTRRPSYGLYRFPT